MTTMLKRMVALALAAGIGAVLLGQRAFARLVQRDTRALLAATSSGGLGLVTQEMLAGLPAPVQRYLTYTGVVGKPIVRTVHLKQQGAMRLAAGQPWIALDAEESYTVQPPGFVWDGTIHAGPFPIGRARDMYLRGHGNMLVRAAGLVTMVHAAGEEMDQSSLMRYLSEMIFFPTAFLGDHVTFEAVDDRSARVTLVDHGRFATGILYVDDEGKLTDFVADRYRMVEGRYELQTWSTPVVAYGEHEGLRLPVRGKAVWKLPEGDLEYIDVTITELHYDAGSHARVPAPAAKTDANSA